MRRVAHDQLRGRTRPPFWTVVACLAVGSLAGGLSGRHAAMSEVWMDGGVPVSLSRFGEAFFFVLGAVAAMAVTAVMLALAGPRLSGRVRGAAAVLLSAVVGFVVAPIALTALSLVFFTIPSELFDLLTV